MDPDKRFHRSINPLALNAIRSALRHPIISSSSSSTPPANPDGHGPHQQRCQRPLEPIRRTSTWPPATSLARTQPDPSFAFFFLTLFAGY